MPFDNILVLAAAAATEAEGGNVASEISKSFHIYPVTFICQLVNFLIVCVVLRKFAFGPVRAMLDARKKRIADGEAKLVEIEKQIAESEEEDPELQSQLAAAGHHGAKPWIGTRSSEATPSNRIRLGNCLLYTSDAADE